MFKTKDVDLFEINNFVSQYFFCILYILTGKFIFDFRKNVVSSSGLSWITPIYSGLLRFHRITVDYFVLLALPRITSSDHQVVQRTTSCFSFDITVDYPGLLGLLHNYSWLMQFTLDYADLLGLIRINPL